MQTLPKIQFGETLKKMKNGAKMGQRKKLGEVEMIDEGHYVPNFLMTSLNI